MKIGKLLTYNRYYKIDTECRDRLSVEIFYPIVAYQLEELYNGLSDNILGRLKNSMYIGFTNNENW